MTATVDPIAFEVLKHRLWQINDEQSAAIKTISASPIVVEGNDFNTGLFTAEGEVVIAGIGSVVHVTTMGDTLRSIIRRAGRIRDGDVFLTNDPFMGALHQNDVVMASPVFVDGEIFMWIGNVLHHPDVGGIDEKGMETPRIRRCVDRAGDELRLECISFVRASFANQ